jgi:tetratricopeptide (TPR) repeat protein
MSDPVIKGAKRSSSRPAPHSAAPKSAGKGRKPTGESAKPKPKRAAAEKAPVKKATPAKSSASAKSAAKSSKQTRPAAKKTAAAKPSKSSASKSAAAKKGGGKAHAAASKAATARKSPAAAHSPSSKHAPAKASKAAASKSAPTAHKAAPRHAPNPPRQPSRDEAAALKAFERAHKDFTRGNFAAAREHFRALIEQHAGVSEVAARARTYLTIAEARLRTEAALPRDPDSLYDRGVIELNRGDFVAAQELFERALKRDPEAADTHYALAAARARLGSVETALQALERAVELRPVLRVRAQADADLAPLRNDPEFERIVFPNTRP